jgi:hypothetical protein
MSSESAFAVPLVIEGLEIGSEEIVASYTAGDTAETRDDSVAIHVATLDVDIDMDNDNGLGTPDRSLAEDHLEDTYRVSGKRLAVNSDDQDHDGAACVPTDRRKARIAATTDYVFQAC